MGKGHCVAGGLRRGDIHYYTFAPPDKERPVLILTRNEGIGILATVTVAPITSTVRDSDSQVYLDVEDGMKSPCVVNLHNLATVSQQRIGRRLAALNEERMKEVCAALTYALGCRL